MASAATAALLTASAADAAEIAYAINHAVTGPNLSGGVGTGSVVGQIVTDGTIGTLAQADIVSWNFLLTGQKGATYSISSATDSTFIFGVGLSATPTQLLFNFSDSGGAIALFQQGLFGGNHYYCLAASSGACAQGESVVPTANTAADAIYAPMSGIVGIAGPGGGGVPPGNGQIAPNPNPIGNTIDVTGNGTNDGPFINDGNIDVGGSLTNNADGTLSNDGNIDIGTNGLFTNLGVVTDGGLVTSLGDLLNSGTWTNGAGSTLTNGQTGDIENIGGAVDNFGTIANNGMLDNTVGSGGIGGLLNNAMSGLITNLGTLINGPGSTLTNGGLLDTIGGLLDNNGTLTNEQTGAIDNIGGTVNNLGTIANDGAFTNSGGSGGIGGLFNNLPGGLFTNLGSLVNGVGGTLDNGGLLDTIGGFLDNNGSPTNEQTGAIDNIGGAVDNLGTFTNDGIVNNTTGSGGLGAVITNATTGLFSNLGTLTNGPGNLVTNIGSFENNGTVNNSGTFDNQAGASVSGSGTFNQLAGGIAEINGAFQNMINMTGGVLGGSGNISGDVNVSAGEVSPGNSPGTLTINGNLTLAASSVYLWQVDELTGDADRIVVSGTAAANATVVVESLNPSTARPGAAVYSILVAGGGLSARNFVLSAPASAIESFVLSYPDANSVQIAADIDFAPAGLSPDQSAVGRAVGAIQSAGITAFQSVSAGIVALPTLAALGHAYDAMSGEGVVAAQQAAFDSGRNVSDTLLARAREAFGVGHVSLVHDAALGGGWNLWLGGMGSSGRLDGAPGIARENLQSRGAIGGIDYRFDSGLVGVAIADNHSGFAVPARTTQGSQDGAHLSLYGAFDGGDGWYASGALDFGTISGHVYRTVIGALPLTGVLSGKLSSGSFAGAVEVGWKQRLELMDVTPFLAVSLQSVDQKAFTEQPSSAAVAPLALHFDKRNSTSVPLSLGIQVAETLRLDDRTTLNPMVRVAWVHEFDPDRAAMAQFAVLPAFGFAVAGARAMEDAARIDAGLQLEIGGGASVLVGGTITASGAGSSAGGEFVVRLAL